MKNPKLMVQIFLLLLIASASVLFVSGCLSANGSENYDSIDMKSFTSEAEMEEYFQTSYYSDYYSEDYFEWEYTNRYSGSIRPSEPNVEYVADTGYIATDYVVNTTTVSPPEPGLSADSSSGPPLSTPSYPPELDISSSFVSRYSDTNVQTVGADEADSVKTDGQTIYYTPDNYYPYNFVEENDWWGSYYTYDTERKTFIIDALPPKDASVLSQLNMSGELYLINNTLVTIHYNLITGYDVSDPASPKEIWKKKLGGYYADSRVIDGKLYMVVLNQTHSLPTNYMGETVNYNDVYYPAASDLIYSETQSIYYVSEVDVQNGNFEKTLVLLSSGNSVVYGSDQYLYLTNNYKIDESVLYLDFIQKVGPDFYPRDVMKKINTIVGYEYIDSGTKAQTIRGVISNYSETLPSREQYDIYINVQNAYFVYAKDVSKSAERTSISRIDLKTFDIKTGSVPGYIINPFSINEYDGNLRIATMRSSNWMSRDQIYSSVHVLDKNMEVIGSLTGLAPDEEIYSSRFAGDKLYLVTFRIIDPFFVIDLSDPKNPTVLGELKIPGYSTYLHPINETAVIGLGQTGSGSMKLTLFDVTNFSNPTEKDSYVFDRQVYSSADDDYHAFMWDADKNLLVIPIYEHAYVFSVSGGKISLVLDDIHEESTVIRTIYINDYFYTFSNREVHILNQNTWERVKVVDIPQPELYNMLPPEFYNAPPPKIIID